MVFFLLAILLLETWALYITELLTALVLEVLVLALVVVGVVDGDKLALSAWTGD